MSDEELELIAPPSPPIESVLFAYITGGTSTFVVLLLLSEVCVVLLLVELLSITGISNVVSLETLGYVGIVEPEVSGEIGG